MERVIGAADAAFDWPPKHYWQCDCGFITTTRNQQFRNPTHIHDGIHHIMIQIQRPKRKVKKGNP